MGLTRLSDWHAIMSGNRPWSAIGVRGSAIKGVFGGYQSDPLILHRGDAPY